MWGVYTTFTQILDYTYVMEWILTPFNIPFKKDNYGGHHQPVYYTDLHFTHQDSTLSGNEKMSSPHIFFFFKKKKDFQPYVKATHLVK